MSPLEHTATPTRRTRRIPTFWFAGRPAALYVEALNKRRQIQTSAVGREENRVPW
jgi:hypothetical protein